MPDPTIVTSPLSGPLTESGIAVGVAIGVPPTLTNSDPTRLTRLGHLPGRASGQFDGCCLIGSGHRSQSAK